MSAENLEVMRRAVAMLNAGADVESAAEELYAEDVEVRDLQPPPDLPAVVRGRQEQVAVLLKWMELFDEWSVEVFEYVDLDPWVVCDLRWRGTGKGSDAVVEWRVADAYELRDGRIATAIHNFADLDAAVEAVRATLKGVKGSRD